MDKHDNESDSQAAAGVSSVDACATGSVGGAAIGASAYAGVGTSASPYAATRASRDDGSETDTIIGAVVLAEILAGNHAATDALTFDTPYTGQELNDDHFTGGGGSFDGGGSDGSWSDSASADSGSSDSSSSDSGSSSSD